TPLELIAFKPSGAYSAAAIPGIQAVHVRSALIKHVGGVAIREMEPGVLVLGHGEILVSAIRTTRVDCGDRSVSIGRGAMVLVSRDGNVLKVRNLHERSNKSVSVLFHAEWLRLAAGAEMILGADETSVSQVLQSDRVGRRRVSGGIAEDGQTLVRCEVSLVSLMQRSVLLRSLMMSKPDRALTDTLTKTAACLMQVTSGHGPYTSDPRPFVGKL